MKKTANLQDIFLTKARKQGVPLTVFLVNGFQMRGSVTGFDSFTVVLLSEGRQQMIYKHADLDHRAAEPHRSARGGRDRGGMT